MDDAALQHLLEPYRNRPRWWLAYSGGLDSHVLLHRVVSLVRAGGLWPPLHALHINHQLNPKAKAWSAHCERVCAALGIELTVLTVEVADAGLGIEAAARTARYAAFASVLGEGELLLQAHHLDDQAETLLLRLMRGTGPAGLAAMPSTRVLGAGALLRPLLGCPRAALLAYAKAAQLQWVEDDSNSNTRFDRNFLRQLALPLLAQRWPGYRQTLSRAALQAGETQELLDALAALDFARAGRGEALGTAELMALTPARQRNLLRHWLTGRALPMPSRAQLEQLLMQAGARADASVSVCWPGAEVHRYQGCLYALKALPPVLDVINQPWRAEAPVPLPGLGALSGAQSLGAGLRADRSYELRNRRGGERCRPLGRAHSQSLKKLLQAAQVPPWLRPRLPLLFCGDELAAVADLWICEGYAAQPSEPGWTLTWRRPI